MKWQKKLKKKQQNFQSKLIQYPEDPEALKKSARIIKQGGLIIFPTKGLYGIGADIENRNAVEKIFRLKKRPVSKPILMLVKNISEVEKYCLNIPKKIFALMENFWPGDITFVLEASKYTPDSLTGGTGKIGVRIPSHPFPKSLLEFVDAPITGTSANISGKNSINNISALDNELLQGTDLVIEAGTLKNKIPSTVIENCGNTIKVLREGRVKKKDLKNFL